MSKGRSSTQREHVFVGDWDARSCASALGRRSDADAALRLARAMAATEHDDAERVAFAAEIGRRFGGEGDAARMVEAALERHPDSVGHHVLFQGEEKRAGRTAELRERYRARYQAAPESVDAAYLYLRLLPHAEALARARPLAAAHPDHVGLARLVSSGELRALRFEAAVPVFERLRGLDLRQWAADDAEDHATALAALGRREEAAALAELAFAQPGVHEERLAAVRGWLEGDSLAAAERLLARGEALDDGSRLRWRLQFWNAEAVASLAALDRDDDRTYWQLVQDAHYRPLSALSLVGQVDRARLLRLEPEVLVLLIAEARRSGHPALDKLEDVAGRHQLGAEGIAAYLERGEWSDGVEELPLSVHAVLHVARSRWTGLAAGERDRLRGLAERTDPVGGFARKAMADWPPA
jgi:hypothetical protein